MIRMKVRLTEEQAEGLKRLAELDGVSVAELVRRSVDQYLKHRGGVSEEERERRLLSIVGIASSGVNDLGVNHDKYLAEIYEAELHGYRGDDEDGE